MTPKKKPKPRLVSHMELPNDGTLHALKFYVRTEDGSDLTAQMVLDALSDDLIDFFPFEQDKVSFADDGMDA